MPSRLTGLEDLAISLSVSGRTGRWPGLPCRVPGRGVREDPASIDDLVMLISEQSAFAKQSDRLDPAIH
jgi:hypothetical protein